MAEALYRTLPLHAQWRQCFNPRGAGRQEVRWSRGHLRAYDGLSASAAKEARSERSVSEKCSGLLLRFVSVADLPPALGPFYHFFEFSFTERRFHAET